MGKDYYRILEVDPSASVTDIRCSYIKLAKKWHPDLKRDPTERQLAKEKFQNISEAFEVLSNPTRKRIYDRGGEEALTAGGKRTVTSPIGPGMSRGIPQNSVNRLAANFSGYSKYGIDPNEGPSGVRTRPKPKPEPEPSPSPSPAPQSTPEIPKLRPVLLPLECTLEELYYGCEKQVQWDSFEGDEHVKKTATISVKSGWMLGHKIDIRDGNDDVMIIVTETPHPRFKRKKTDLYCDCDITILQAMCSGEIVIPTLTRDKNLKLKFGGVINDGYEHRITGQGMPIENSKVRGDLVITFHVKLPTNLTKDQRERIGAILRENDQ